MLVVFSAIFMMDTKIISGHNFGAPLKNQNAGADNLLATSPACKN